MIFGREITDILLICCRIGLIDKYEVKLGIQIGYRGYHIIQIVD
jgi:hypothetical protein